MNLGEYYNSKEFKDEYSKELQFPFDDIDPKKKDYNWFLAHNRAMWSEYMRNNCYLSYSIGTNEYDYTTLRLYSQGNQPVEKYKEQLAHVDPEKNDGSRTMYESGISWDNESVLPRFKESVLAILMKMDVVYSPKAVDDASMNLKSRIKNMIWEKSQNDFYMKAYQKLGLDYDAGLPFIPANQTELDLFAQTALEISVEIKTKKIIDAVFDENEWDEELKYGIYEDLYDLGVALQQTYINPKTGKEVIEQVDPATALFQKSKRKTYKDVKRVGHVVWYTVADVRERYQQEGQYLDEKEFFSRIKNIVNSQKVGINSANWNREQWSNDVKDSHGRYPYDYMKIPVFCYEFMSWNTDKITEKENGRTYYETYDAEVKTTKTIKTTAKKYEAWYRSEWVIGTDMLISFGPRPWVTRDAEGKTVSSYTIYRLNNKSMVAQQIPIEDKIELLLKKYMLAWKRAAPAGFRINWAKLQGMSMKNGSKLHPFEVLDIYLDTGVMFENDTKENIAGSRGGSQAQSFSLIPGGMGPILNEFITAFQTEMQKLSIITGITDAVLGADPKPNQLIGTTQIAREGSLNRLDPYFSAYKWMKKNVYKKVLIDVLNYARFNPTGFSATYKDFNDNTIEKVSIGAEESGARFKLVVEMIATEEMKTIIIQSAQQALAKGMISETDMITLIENIMKGNIKFAKMLLEYKSAKMMQLQQQIAKQNAEQNIAAQQQSAMITTEGKVKEIQEEGNQDRETEKVIGQIKLLLQQHENQKQRVAQ